MTYQYQLLGEILVLFICPCKDVDTGGRGGRGGGGGIGG